MLEARGRGELLEQLLLLFGQLLRHLDLHFHVLVADASALSGVRYQIIVAVLLLSPAPSTLLAQDTKITTDSVPVKGADWNEFDLGFTTLRFGLGIIHEYAAYDQDDEGQAQTDSI